MNPALASFQMWHHRILVAICPCCDQIGLIRHGRCWMCGGWTDLPPRQYPARAALAVSDLLKGVSLS